MAIGRKNARKLEGKVITLAKAKSLHNVKKFQFKRFGDQLRIFAKGNLIGFCNEKWDIDQGEPLVILHEDNRLYFTLAGEAAGEI